MLLKRFPVRQPPGRAKKPLVLFIVKSSPIAPIAEQVSQSVCAVIDFAILFPVVDPS
jgi:hypothetical protein